MGKYKKFALSTYYFRRCLYCFQVYTISNFDDLNVFEDMPWYIP